MEPSQLLVIVLLSADVTPSIWAFWLWETTAVYSLLLISIPFQSLRFLSVMKWALNMQQQYHCFNIIYITLGSWDPDLFWAGFVIKSCRPVLINLYFFFNLFFDSTAFILHLFKEFFVIPATCYNEVYERGGFQKLSFLLWFWNFVEGKGLQMDFQQCPQLNIWKMSSSFLLVPSPFRSALSRQRAGCTTLLTIYLHLPPPQAGIVRSRTFTEWGHFIWKQELWKALFRKITTIPAISRGQKE